MGDRYQRHSEEKQRELYWSQFPRWYWMLAKIFHGAVFILFMAMGIYANIGWIIVELYRFITRI